VTLFPSSGNASILGPNNALAFGIIHIHSVNPPLASHFPKKFQGLPTPVAGNLNLQDIHIKNWYKTKFFTVNALVYISNLSPLAVDVSKIWFRERNDDHCFNLANSFPYSQA